MRHLIIKLVNIPIRKHLFFQNVNIIACFHSYTLEKKSTSSCVTSTDYVPAITIMIFDHFMSGFWVIL